MSDTPSSRRSRDESRFAKATGDRGQAAADRGQGTHLRPGASAGTAGDRRLGPRRPPIHRLELALFFVVSAHLVMLPWAFGTMRPPAQVCSFVLAVVGFVLALVPRAITAGQNAEKLKTETLKSANAGGAENAEKLKTEALKSADPRGTPALPGDSGQETGDRGQETGDRGQATQGSRQAGTPAAPQKDPLGVAQAAGPDRLSTVHRPLSTGSASSRYSLLSWPKLLRFPIFWLGLGLLGLILIQALNPAWAYQTDGKVWWMRAIPHLSWLPTGVEVPFSGVFRTAQGGPWRMLLIYGSAWLTVCAVWVGFTRRRTLQWLFVIVVGNGLAISLFGLAQRVLGVRTVFWTRPPTNEPFFGPFLYKNHAGGYLLLTLAVAVAVGAWYYVRAVRRLDKSSPAGVFAFIVTCIAVSIFVSYARGATLVTLGYLSLVVIGFIVFQWRLPAAARSPVIAIALLLAFGVFLKTGLTALNSGRAWDRLQQALSGQEITVEWRKVANQASAEMLADHWVSGVGSGGFQFLYPAYLKNYPSIGVNKFWPHAHNDLLQIPIELGLAGVLIIVASFAYWGVLLARHRAWQNPLSVCLIVALLMFVAMSWGDFFFYSVPILVTWCTLWPAVARWTMLEEQRAA